MIQMGGCLKTSWCCKLKSTLTRIVEMFQRWNSSDWLFKSLNTVSTPMWNQRNAITGLYLATLLLLGNPGGALEFLFSLRSTPLTRFSFNWRQLTYERKTISALNTLFAVCQGHIAHHLSCLVALLWYKK